MKPQRLFDILTYRKQTTPQRAVWAVRKGNEWVKIYVDQYIDYVDYVSGFLLYKGLKPGGKVALISGNRPEWNYVDMGVQQVGGIVVPIYPTISESDYRYVLSNSEVSYLVVETELLLGKLKDIIIQQPTLQMVCVINPIKFDSPVVSELQASGREVVQFSDWIRLGQQEVDRDAISQRMQAIAPDDVATIIYTSGSMGVPKGVMLTHTNILTCVYGVSSIPPSHYERAMSFLPLCHVYERMMNYFYQYMGYETYYAENVGKVVENMNTAKPHIMTAVPRFVEKMYDGIYRKGERLKGLRKKIFYWSLSLGTKYRLEGNTLWYRMRRNWADILVYRQIRESFGGCLEMLVTGGSAIQPRLARFFTCVGMAIYEGYGLSETSPVISVSSSGIWGREWGTAGPPLSGIEVRIDDETGEILCRGSNVMKGYYKSPDLTSQVIDSDGWFHTGDTGAFTEHGCLRITGRTKT
ncbi:MAG: AMP-binding protein, partial [Bacteroidales bacterium]|nr:AMP-binding protein [Candidatus Colimorpha onthohippi]